MTVYMARGPLTCPPTWRIAMVAKEFDRKYMLSNGYIRAGGTGTAGTAMAVLVFE